MTTTSDILASFPHPVLTPLAADHQPNATSLHLLHRERRGNAMAVTSTRGGGAHGHLSLVLTDAAYLAVANVPSLLWLLLTQANIPLMLPLQPQHNSPKLITSSPHSWPDSPSYVGTRNALRQCIIKAVPALYLDVLKSREFGQATNTPMDLPDHLDTAYDNITSDELQTNLDTMEPLGMSIHLSRHCGNN